MPLGHYGGGYQALTGAVKIWGQENDLMGIIFRLFWQ